MTLDRRRFLQLATAGMLASLAETACTSGDDTNATVEPLLVEMLGPERVRQIGTQYRAEVPQESSAAALREAIGNSRRRGFASSYLRSIESQVHEDFRAARIVVVSGWVLSVTEARQCALFSLSA